MKVVVLGAGIVGLWTAYLLSKEANEVEIISQAHPLSTTSAVAASVLTPFLPWDPKSDLFATQVKWAAETLAYFQSLSVFSEVAQKIECYEFGRDNLLEDSFPVEKLKYLEFSTFVRHDLKAEIAGLDFAIGYECYLCYPWIFLPWILSEIEKMGGKLTITSISKPSDIADLSADVVFNCLGYQTIFPDNEAYPVFGQSMFIPTEVPAERYFGIGANDHGVFRHKRGFYLGSFFIKGANHMVPQQEIYQRSLKFVTLDYPRLCASIGIDPPLIDVSKIERVQSGIRPFRKTGPLIRREEAFGKTLIHNYGHGAHGWTIGYSSAREAVSLLSSDQSKRIAASPSSERLSKVEPMTVAPSRWPIKRLVKASELARCAELMSETNPWKRLSFSKNQCETSLKRRTVRVDGLLDDNGEVLGFLASIAEGVGSEPLVEYLCIAPAVRSHGFGTRLMDFFEYTLFPDADNLYLFVSDINPLAAKLYLRLGYVPVGALPNFNLVEQTEFLYRKSRRPRQAKYTSS